MTRIQNNSAKIKKTLKFAWRHFFTLVVGGMILTVVVRAPLNFKNALIFLSVAILIDWAKQFIKLDRNFSRDSRQVHPYDDDKVPLHVRQYWNSSIPGTPAYNSRNFEGIRHD